MGERTPARGLPVDGPVDEVGVDLGPDERGHGLLDTWSGRTLPGTDGGQDITGVVGEQGPDQVALSSWLAAGYARDADPARLSAIEGKASRGLRARIADEGLDPLPRADPLTVPPVVAPPAPAPSPVATEAPNPGDGEVSAALLFVAVAVALCAGAAGAWLVLGGF